MLKEKFEFATSPRFYALLIGAVSIYLEAKGYIGEPERNLIAAVMAGFVTIRTVDRVSEQKVIAAKESGKVTTVSLPENTTVTASTGFGD